MTNSPNDLRIQEQSIVDFLQSDPEFFSRNAELLGTIRLYSPHGGRTIGLQERQAELLREKIKSLESRLLEWIQHSNQNALIADKLQGWTTRLLSVSDARQLPEQLLRQLQDAFLVPQIALRLWGVQTQYADLPEASLVQEQSKRFATSLTQSYCGAPVDFEGLNWLPQPDTILSVALLPLRADGKTFGMLVLASPDAQRFHAGMGVEFLERIAHTASAALSKLSLLDTPQAQ